MRDIHKVLELWGAWVANNHEDVVWSHMPQALKALFRRKLNSVLNAVMMMR